RCTIRSLVPLLSVSIIIDQQVGATTSLLTILCIGQVVNVCMGSVGLVLNMTGNERASLKAQGITLVITTTLLCTLVPFYQEIGAAVAISIGLVSWNIIMAFDVYRLTGLKTWLILSEGHL
ncbi:polysaccharide biosynthesis C-terminal domain-containing protein, partial [Vibrio algivorus]